MKAAGRTIDPLVVGALRTAVAGMAAAAVVLWLWRSRRVLPSQAGDWLLLAAGALGNYVAFPLLVSLGLTATTAARASLVFGAAPALTALLGAAAMHDPLSSRRISGIGIALAGVVLLIGPGALTESGHGRWHGPVLVFLGTAGASVSYVVGAHLGRRLGAWPVVAYSLVGASLPLAVPLTTVWAADVAGITAEGWVSILYLSLLGSFVANALWVWALSRGSVVDVGTTQFLLPVLSVIAAALFLDETLSPTALLAGLVVLVGVWLVQGRALPKYPATLEHETAPARMITDRVTRETACLVTSYELVHGCLLDPRLSTDERYARPAGPSSPTSPTSSASIDDDREPERRSLLGTDPPDHDELRRLVSPWFTPAAVEAWRPTITRICCSAIEALAGGGDGGKVDLVRDYALVVPVRVIHAVLGIPDDQQEPPEVCMDRFWRASFAEPPDGEAFELLDDSMRRLVAYKRDHPGDDVTTALLGALVRGDLRHEGELRDLLFTLVGAGHTTTVLTLGKAILRLLEHPDELTLARRDPELWRHVLDEVLRHDSTVQVTTRRYARVDMTIGDSPVPQGTTVLLSPAAANRDPQRFEDPGRFDIRRGSRGPAHLGFGRGIHSCLGAHLARLEGEIALRTLFESVPGVRLSVASHELRWTTGSRLRGPAELPVSFRHP